MVSEWLSAQWKPGPRPQKLGKRDMNKLTTAVLASTMIVLAVPAMANHVGSGRDPGSAISGANRSVSAPGANNSERLYERQRQNEAARRGIARGGLKNAVQRWKSGDNGDYTRGHGYNN